MKKIEQLFNKYRDVNDSQKISSDGVVKFLEDLQLSPESRHVLIIAWKFRAQTQCEFSRDEFVNGFCDLACDSLDKLKQKLPQLEQDLNDMQKFKDFYHFTFNYAKDSGQKGLDLEMAIAYWNIVLKDRFKFLDLWCKFLTVNAAQILHDTNELKLDCLLGKPQTIHPEGHVEFTARLRTAHRRQNVELRRGRSLVSESDRRRFFVHVFPSFRPVLIDDFVEWCLQQQQSNISSQPVQQQHFYQQSKSNMYG